MLPTHPVRPAYDKKNGYLLLGGVRFLLSRVFLLLLVPALVWGQTMELDEVNRLAKGGAAQLALSLLDANQPSHELEPKQWIRWERVRIRILQSRGRWQALAQRLATLPPGLPDEYRQWSDTRRADALIRTGDYGEARKLLRHLIWQGGPTSELLAELRQLVMQSYLAEGRIDDAHAAMLRFHQDYGDGSVAARLLRAKVLLAGGRAGEGRLLLERQAQEGEVPPLLMLARLRAGSNPATIVKEARETALSADLPLELGWLWLATLAEAAHAAEDDATLIIALERLYQLPPMAQSEQRLFSWGPSLLWDAYISYASRVGNREQLLIGDDVSWFAAADATEMRYPVRKHSLYALLGRQAASAEGRERAHQALVEQLREMEGGVTLLRNLYLHGGYYGVEQGVPQGVAYLLVDDAIREGELSLASQLLQHLPEPPGGTARFAWQLRRAKVFLLAADYKQAVALLGELLPQVASQEGEPLDQLIQLLFDLQTVGQNEYAYTLLSELYEKVTSMKIRRELLFWMADSRKAQHQAAEAARLYLASATLPDNNSMDPWAQTARYQAAQSLAEAGLLEDAENIYRQLLRVTESAERRSVLLHELQQLHLLAGAERV